MRPTKLELVSLGSTIAFVAALAGCSFLDALHTAAFTPGPSGVSPSDDILDGISILPSPGGWVKIGGGIAALLLAAVTLMKSGTARTVAVSPYTLVARILKLFRPGK